MRISIGKKVKICLLSIFIVFIWIIDASAHNHTKEILYTNNDSLVSRIIKLPIKSLTNSGYKLLEHNKYDEALTYYTIAASKGKEDKNLSGEDLREYAKALNNIGYIHLFYQNNTEKAYPYLLQARKIAEDAKEYDILAGIIDNIAKVYDDFGDSAKAIELYNQAMQYAGNEDTEISPVMQIMLFNDLVNCAVANDKTIDIQPSLEIFNALPSYDLPMGRYSKRMCEGLQKIKAGNLKEATSIIASAERLIDANQDSMRYVVDHLLTLANVYNMRHLADSAYLSLNEAHQLAISNLLYDRLPRIYHGLGTVAYSKGDSITGQRMHLRAYEENEKLHSARVFTNIKRAETDAEVDNLNLIIAEERLRHSHRLTIIWILAGAGVIVIILLLFILQRNRMLTQSLQDLVERHKAAMKSEEVNSRLRKEYEETILHLKEEIENTQCKEKGDSEEKRMVLPVDEDERIRIIGAVSSTFDESPLIYENTFSIGQLAELVHTKPRYLSSLLNESFGKTFSELLSEARVKKACSLLLSPEFQSTLTIEAIAEKVGYKSRTHFTSVFKKITGVSPLQYMAASK